MKQFLRLTKKAQLTYLFLWVSIFTVLQLQAQLNQWTWMGGSNLANQYGSFGTREVISTNNIPGGRSFSVNWTDNNGNLWLWGGVGYAASSSGDLNDLWKYDVEQKAWVWMHGDNTINEPGVYGTVGVANSANKPGARQDAFGWKDREGNLWLFGGTATGGNYFADLWKYTIGTNQWTCIRGNNNPNQYGVYGTKGIANSSNTPGSRRASINWVDTAGNFWLFGGNGYATSGAVGYLNDLWKYDVSTNEWTWVNGDNITGQTTVYGTQGVASSTNKPGIRMYGGSWVDNNNNLWFFGGGSTTSFLYADLWKYNISTNEWTWVKGPSLSLQNGIYGTQGVADINNNPGSRVYCNSWKDKDGNFWIFGGLGRSASGSTTIRLNDLWKYNVNNNEWTWVKGSTAGNQNGIFGTLGIANNNNNPGTRSYSNGWTDNEGNLWLFGGFGYPASTTTNAQLNDFWKFTLSTTLSVKIISVQAKIENNYTYITWNTANEKNIKQYIIQTGKSQSSFEDIGIVASKNLQNAQYQFAHQFAPNNLQYYRIKAVDYDGKETYSNIIKLDLKVKQQNISVYPNPANNQISIHHPTVNEPTQLIITNYLGVTIKRIPIAAGSVYSNIQIQDLKSGTYTITIQTKNEFQSTKFIKQ